MNYLGAAAGLVAIIIISILIYMLQYSHENNLNAVNNDNITELNRVR